MLLIQGRRASQRSALAPGYYIPRLRRYAELLPADEVVDGLVVERLSFVVRRATGPGLGEVVAVLKRYYEVVHHVLVRHRQVARIDIREAKFIRTFDRRLGAQSNLIVHGAKMGEHQVVAVEMIDGHHLNDVDTNLSISFHHTASPRHQSEEHTSELQSPYA